MHSFFSPCRRWLAVALFALTLICPAQAETLHVRFAPEKDYGPFIYQNEQGQVSGLSFELLQAIAPGAGLELQVLPAAPLNQILAAVQRGEVDLVSSLRPTPERAEYLAFSKPYVSIPAVLVTRKGDPAQSLLQLGGEPVAVGRAYAVEGFVRERYPQVSWQAVSDDLQGFTRLEQGQVRGLVIDMASLLYLARQSGKSDWQVAQQVGFDYQLSFAYPKAQQELGIRLERALQDLPADRRAQILARWLDPQALRQGSQPRALLWWGLGALALALMLLGAKRWQQRRRHAV